MRVGIKNAAGIEKRIAVAVPSKSHEMLPISSGAYSD